MTEGFRSTPPLTGPPSYAGNATDRQQEVQDTVQRIMGEDIAPLTAPTSPPPAASGGDSSTTNVAKEQAGEVADTAKQAGAQVADTVKEQAGQVTAEAKNQAKQLLSQAQSELSEQAAGTQQRVSEGLHALADELSGMAKNSEQDGVATDLARQAADKARQAAGWLGDRDPGSLLDEVRTFARKKPGTYLALALGAGVLAGRLTRGLTAPSDDDSSDAATAPATPNPAYQVGTGRPPLTGSELPTTPVGYDPSLVAGPEATGALGGLDGTRMTPPLSGPGATGGLGGTRGDLTP